MNPLAALGDVVASAVLAGTCSALRAIEQKHRAGPTLDQRPSHQYRYVRPDFFFVFLTATSIGSLVFAFVPLGRLFRLPPSTSQARSFLVRSTYSFICCSFSSYRTVRAASNRTL